MNKIIKYENLKEFLDRIKSQGSLTLVGGVFDILHSGHIEFLQASKKQGEILLVMLESDEAVKNRKGENRPIHSQKIRAEILSSLESVDFILLLPTLKTDKDYDTLVKTLAPDIIAVTEADPYRQHKLNQAKMVGGKVVEVIKRLPHSTSSLSKNITV